MKRIKQAIALAAVVAVAVMGARSLRAGVAVGSGGAIVTVDGATDAAIVGVVNATNDVLVTALGGKATTASVTAVTAALLATNDALVGLINAKLTTNAANAGLTVDGTGTNLLWIVNGVTNALSQTPQ